MRAQAGSGQAASPSCCEMHVGPSGIPVPPPPPPITIVCFPVTKRLHWAAQPEHERQQNSHQHKQTSSRPGLGSEYPKEVASRLRRGMLGPPPQGKAAAGPARWTDADNQPQRGNWRVPGDHRQSGEGPAFCIVRTGCFHKRKPLFPEHRPGKAGSHSSPPLPKSARHLPGARHAAEHVP